MSQQTEHKESIEKSRPPISKREDIFIDLTGKKGMTHDYKCRCEGNKLRVTTMFLSTDATAGLSSQSGRYGRSWSPDKALLLGTSIYTPRSSLTTIERPNMLPTSTQ